MRAHLAAPLLPLLFSGCMSGYTVTNFSLSHGHAEYTEHHEHAEAAARSWPAGYGASVVVLQSRHLDRATEVLKIIDIHVPVGGQDAALAALQAEAAAVGADAVVGAEFHHGDGNGEPIHVSGMAVRYIELAPYP